MSCVGFWKREALHEKLEAAEKRAVIAEADAKVSRGLLAIAEAKVAKLREALLKIDDETIDWKAAQTARTALSEKFKTAEGFGSHD